MAMLVITRGYLLRKWICCCFQSDGADLKLPMGQKVELQTSRWNMVNHLTSFNILIDPQWYMIFDPNALKYD